MASSGFISHPISAIKTCREICYCYFSNFFFSFRFFLCVNKSVSFYLGNDGSRESKGENLIEISMFSKIFACVK